MTQTKLLSRIIVFCFVLLGIFVDMYTTLRHPSFLLLESNTTWVATGSLIWLWGIKFLLICIVWIALFKTEWISKTNFMKFFYISFIVLVISIQLYAGYNNNNVKQNIATLFNHSDISDVTSEEIQTIAPSKDDLRQHYFKTLILLFYFPFFASLLSFAVYRHLYK